MNTLWIYGDSFSTDYKDEEWIWTRALAHRFADQNLIAHYKNASVAGCSNDWISTQIAHDIDTWQQGDSVIVIPTEPSRQWWFADAPELSNIISMRGSPEAKSYTQRFPERVTAVNYYYTQIWRNTVDSMRYEQMIAWLKLHALDRGVNLVLMPAFDVPTDYKGIVHTQGSLTETVCNGEFINDKEMSQWYSTGLDTRYNHMCKRNHAVLVDKLWERFTQGTPVDLTQGFDTQFLSLKDRLTRMDELGAWLIDRAKVPPKTPIGQF